MENFYEKVKLIEAEFKNSGYEIYSQKLANLIIEGGTIGEKFASIAFELDELKKMKPEIYLIAKPEIDEILDYAKSIGYLE